MIRKLTRTPPSRRYARAIRRLVAAEVAHSWKGGTDPDWHDSIDRERKRARAAVRNLLRELDHA